MFGLFELTFNFVMIPKQTKNLYKPTIRCLHYIEIVCAALNEVTCLDHYCPTCAACVTMPTNICPQLTSNQSPDYGVPNQIWSQTGSLQCPRQSPWCCVQNWELFSKSAIALLVIPVFRTRQLTSPHTCGNASCWSKPRMAGMIACSMTKCIMSVTDLAPSLPRVRVCCLIPKYAHEFKMSQFIRHISAQYSPCSAISILTRLFICICSADRTSYGLCFLLGNTRLNSTEYGHEQHL